MGLTEQFLDTYPLRRTRRVGTVPQAARNATLRIVGCLLCELYLGLTHELQRIRAYLAFFVIDTDADWDSETRCRYRTRSRNADEVAVTE
jgi:hypothetical protein